MEIYLDMAKYMILGVGNTMRGDDGAGSIISQEFAKKISEFDPLLKDWKSVDGALLPENYTSVIKKESPDKLFIVDVCNMERPYGAYHYIKLEKLLGSYQFNAHSAPIKLFIDYLSDHIGEIIMIGIQPKNMNMFDPVSDEVEKSIKEIIDILSKEEFDKITKLED